MLQTELMLDGGIWGNANLMKSMKWLEDERFKDWLKPTKDPFEVRCELCRKTFKIETMGMKSLDSHLRFEKHKTYASTRKSTIPIESFRYY